MRARPTLVALAVILVTAGVSVAAEKVDVVVLQNGTRVVGEVRSMKRGKLELKTDDMGTLQIEWADVVQVTAPEYFEVEDMRGRLRFGALRPSADGSRLAVVNVEGEQALPLPEVARIQLVEGDVLGPDQRLARRGRELHERLGASAARPGRQPALPEAEVRDLRGRPTRS